MRRPAFNLPRLIVELAVTAVFFAVLWLAAIVGAAALLERAP